VLRSWLRRPTRVIARSHACARYAAGGLVCRGEGRGDRSYAACDVAAVRAAERDGACTFGQELVRITYCKGGPTRG
jgi:hypothetical protein